MITARLILWMHTTSAGGPRTPLDSGLDSGWLLTPTVTHYGVIRNWKLPYNYPLTASCPSAYAAAWSTIKHPRPLAVPVTIINAIRSVGYECRRFEWPYANVGVTPRTCIRLKRFCGCYGVIAATGSDCGCFVELRHVGQEDSWHVHRFYWFLVIALRLSSLKCNCLLTLVQLVNLIHRWSCTYATYMITWIFFVK